PQNFLSYWLLRRWLQIPYLGLIGMSHIEKYELLNRNLTRFWYVADYKLCDQLIASLARELGIPDRAARRNTAMDWQRRSKWKPLREQDLSSTSRDAFYRLNTLDQALWKTWRQAEFATAAVQPTRFA